MLCGWINGGFAQDASEFWACRAVPQGLFFHHSTPCWEFPHLPLNINSKQETAHKSIELAFQKSHSIHAVLVHSSSFFDQLVSSKQRPAPHRWSLCVDMLTLYIKRPAVCLHSCLFFGGGVLVNVASVCMWMSSTVMQPNSVLSVYLCRHTKTDVAMFYHGQQEWKPSKDPFTSVLLLYRVSSFFSPHENHDRKWMAGGGKKCWQFLHLPPHLMYSIFSQSSANLCSRRTTSSDNVSFLF